MRIHAVLALLFLLLSASAARAESANERLFRLNSMVSAGLTAVEIDWAAKTADQQKALARAEGIAEEVKASLTPDLAQSPLYGSVVSRLGDLNSRLGPAKSGVGCSVARDQATAALVQRDQAAARAALDDFAGHLRRVQAASGMTRAIGRFSAEKKDLDARLAALEKQLADESAAARKAEAEKARAQAAAEAEAKRKAEADAKAAAEKLRLQQLADKKAQEAQARAEVEEKKRAEAAKKAFELEEAERRRKEEAAAREQARLDQQRQQAEKLEQARAEREAKEAAERAAKAAAEAEKERERNDPRRALNNVRVARDPLLLALRDKPGPVPARDLAAATAALAELRRLDVDRAVAEGALVEQIALRSFARAPLGVEPLGSRIVARLGVLAPRATVDLVEGWCYALVASSEAFFTHTVEATTPLVQFRQSATTSSQLAGFCAGRTAQATVALAENAGKANVLVLGWPSPKVPLAVALHAGLSSVSTCDEAAMANAWRALLPGSVLFATAGDGAGPVLVLDTGVGGNVPVRVVGTDGVERQLPRPRLSDKPVAAPLGRVPSAQCPEAGPRLRVAPDPEQCRAASDVAAAPALAALRARLLATTDDAARLAVERELRALDDEARRRRAVDCVAVDESPVRVWRAAQHDGVYKNPPAATGRARSLALEASETP